MNRRSSRDRGKQTEPKWSTLPQWKPGFRFGLLWDPSALDLIHNTANLLIAPHQWRDAEPVRGDIQWSQWIRQMQFCQDYDLELTNHALIWRNSVSPAWITLGTWTKTDLLRAMHDWITPVVRMLVQTGRCFCIDVVNEHFVTPVAQNIFEQVLGYPEYVIWAVRFAQWARAGAPVKLRINENFGPNNSTNGQPTRLVAMLNLIDRLDREGLHVDAIGMQSHLDADAISASGDLYVDHLVLLADECEKRGLDLHVSEFDLRQGTEDAFVQALYTETYFKAAYEHPACTSFSTWGVHDGNSWLGPAAKPLLFDEQQNPKLSWEAVNGVIRGSKQ